jgi:flagellin-specific chaperone FliS
MRTNKDGCEFGNINRVLINEVKTSVDDIKSIINKMENKMDKNTSELQMKMTDLYNHQSSRLPMGITALLTILSSLVVGLIVYVIKI